MDIKAEEGQTIKNDIAMSENQEIAIYDGSENSKSIHFYKNNTVRLVNEFYGKFYSRDLCTNQRPTLDTNLKLN